MCTYHGWTYDLEGRLVGVPGFKEVYHEDWTAERGLPDAAGRELQGLRLRHPGPDAPPLEEYLGDVGRSGIDQLAVPPRDMTVVAGIQKYTIPCNWKFATDNVWDFYHPPGHPRRRRSARRCMGLAGGRSPTARRRRSTWSDVERGGGHRSSAVPGERASPARGSTRWCVLGEYGRHDRRAEGDVAGQRDVDRTWRTRPERAGEALGPVGQAGRRPPAHLPDVLDHDDRPASLRIPRPPTTTEIWWFIVRRTDDLPPEIPGRCDPTIGRLGFRTGGMLEQDDGENWGQSTTRPSARQPPDAAPPHMGLGRGKVVKEHGLARIDGAHQRARPALDISRWAQWLKGPQWDDLAPPPSHPT